MAKAGYAVTTIAGPATGVPLAAATLKYVIGVNGTASFGVDLKKIRISTDGITASATPIYVELCRCTFATNPPGTNSTTATVQQVYGPTITPGFVAAVNWTAAPTVVTQLEEWWLDPNKSTVIYDSPLGDTYDSPVSVGFVVRCTAAAIVNLRGTMIFERT